MIASRSSSMPASRAASALIAGMPTIAVQARADEAGPSRASSNDTDEVTATVLPRRSPSGSNCISPSGTGSGGSAGTVRVLMTPACCAAVNSARNAGRMAGRRSGASGGWLNGSGSATA